MNLVVTMTMVRRRRVLLIVISVRRRMVLLMRRRLLILLGFMRIVIRIRCRCRIRLSGSLVMRLVFVPVLRVGVSLRRRMVIILIR